MRRHGTLYSCGSGRYGIPRGKTEPGTSRPAREIPAEELFTLLKKKDPARAGTIDSKNPRRLIRALEIVEAIGKVPEPSLSPLDTDILFIGVKKEKRELERLIKIRLERRLRAGMLKEIVRLHKNGVSWKRMEELGLEYRYAARFLKGKITKAEFKEVLTKEIIAYAKRQMTWFKRDSRIVWVTMNTEAIQKVGQFIKTKP